LLTPAHHEGDRARAPARSDERRAGALWQAGARRARHQRRYRGMDDHDQDRARRGDREGVAFHGV